MAPHIVSWGRNEDSERIAPVTSSAGTASVVSIETLVSAPRATQNTPITPGTWRARLTAPRSRPASFLGMESGESEAPTDSQNGDSFLRSSKYFFKDGNVTFLVDGFLYCVHRFFFSRDSEYFSTRFAQLEVRDHEALSTIISLGDIECEDFEAFLSVLYPENFEEHDLSYEQWRSVLDLTTRWGFDSLRKLALTSIKPRTAYDRLLLARKYAVDDWVIPALTGLCDRASPLSLDEAREMSIEDVVLIATVREDIRSRIVFISPAEVSRRVEEMQTGKPVPVPAAGNEASPVCPTSEGTEQRPCSSVTATAGFVSGVPNMGTPVTEPFKDNTPMSGSVFGAPSMKQKGDSVEQQTPTEPAEDDWGFSVKPKKKKGAVKSKAVVDRLEPGTTGAASSARAISERPRKQGVVDCQAPSEAAGTATPSQAVDLPPQPSAGFGLFGRVSASPFSGLGGGP